MEEHESTPEGMITAHETRTTIRSARKLERQADRLADRAARLQQREGVTERVEQMYADARIFRAMAWAAQTD